jgi:hypothetical protein
MNKFLLEVVFSVVPMTAFAAGSATSSSTPGDQQAATCTAHDLLEQKLGNAYHTQFPTNCNPVSTSTTGTSASHNGDTSSGNQESPKQQ